MRIFSNRWLGTVVLAGVYALGLTGIIASSGSDGDGNDDNACTLQIGAIARATNEMIPTNDVWVGLLAKTGSGSYLRVVRVDDSGLEVNSYSVPRGTQNGLVKTLAVATDTDNAGDVYVGGDFEGGILRLNADGTIDADFAVGAGFDGSVNSIVAADDGSGDIYVGGNFTQYDGDRVSGAPGKTVSGLVRLRSDGLLDDVGFTAAPVADVEGIALIPGYIYSGGTTRIGTTRTAALWDTLGTLITDFTPAVAEIYAVARTMNGDLYAGGNSTTGVVRLDLLTGNNVGSFDSKNFDSSIQTIVRVSSSSDDIYVGGGFSTYDNLSANSIIRLAGDGSRRDTFVIGDGFTDNANNPASTGLVEAIARAEDGTTDIYVGGRFAYYDGSRSNGIARLNASGSLDQDFDIDISVAGEPCVNDTGAAL